MLRIEYEEAFNILKDIHIRFGFSEERADISAGLFCDTNRDGILSHGFARFPNLIAAIESGRVIPGNTPEQNWSGGALERWDGRQGPGNLNALHAMNRAMELADQYGVGIVALSSTNHWMRGGNYGWQAAEAGKIGICWTNTMPNLPPWGSDKPLIGNNPLILAVPRDGGHIVLDMAMSQFSYGALDGYSTSGRKLPVPGGWDLDGNLTDNAAEILESKRPLPIGFWKGSGLSIMLDITAAMLSGGKSTCDIEPNPGSETGISQVFMALSPPENPGMAEKIVESLKLSGSDVYYPGERTLNRRLESDRLGLPVTEATWKKILDLR